MNKTTDKQIEALKLALEALEIGHEYAVETAEHFHIEMAGYKQHRHDAMDAEVKQIADAITAIRESLADHIVDANKMVEQPAQQQGWKLVPVQPTDEMRDAGNAIIGDRGALFAAYRAMLNAAPQPAQQEPVAWATREDFYRELGRSVERAREEMKVKSVTMRCKDYDLALPIIDAHFGHVLVGQISTPPTSKPWVGLTDEDTYEATGTACTDLLALAKLWSDNKIHVYQFDNEARKIIEAVLRRASAKLREKNNG